ncbi:MAG: hypothetical protein Fur0016_20470 [Anaerolineales bacterium]
MFPTHFTKFSYLLIAALVITAVLVATQPPYQAQAAYGDRITISGGQFMAGGQRIWMNGVNTPWDQWNDFGGGYNSAWWSSHFDALKAANINAIRVWITCNGEVGINIDSNGYVSGATAAHWSHLDDFFSLAQSKGIYVMATLISFDHFKDYHPNYQRWRNWINSDSNIDSYINNYLSTFLNRYKNNPYLWSIDLINEPDWVATTEGGPATWARLQQYFAKASKYIHDNSNVLVTVGLAMVKYNGTGCSGCIGNMVSDGALQAQVNHPNARLDFYSVHWYSWMYQYWSSPFHKTPAEYGMATDKLNMLGENPGLGIYSGTAGTCGNGSTLLFNMAQAYENAYQKGWQGLMSWTSNGAGSDGCGTLANDIANGTTSFYNNHANLVYPGSSSPTNTPVPATNTPVAPTATSVPGNGNARSGSWAVRLVNSTGNWKNVHQQVSVSTNTNYKAAIWIKGSGQVDLIVHADAWGTELASTRCTASGNYSECAVNFNSGGNTKVGLRLTNGTSGQDMYLDDAFLGVSGGTNLVANSNFENGSANWYVEAPFVIQNVGGSSPTNTPIPPTNTPVPATATPTHTNTPIPPTNTPTGGLTIYGDSTSWENWSWNTTVNLNNSSPVQAGSKSIAVTYTSGWGGLSLRKAGGQSTAGYSKITFYVHGGSGGTRKFNFYINTSDSGGQSASVSVSAPAGQWTLVTINLSQVGNPSKIARINFQENTGGSQAVFYIDEIKLVP